MSLQGSVLALADGTAEALGLLRRPLQAEALLALARRRSGLDEFGDTAFVDPLRRLLAACADEASLSLVGRMATRWDVVRFLSNLLRFQDAEDARSRHRERAHRATDLHHRPAAQRHHLSAPAAAAGSGQSCAAGLADDLSVSAGARAGCASGARGAAVARLRAARPGIPRAASARRHLAAGVQRDHRARVPQPALRHDLSHPELSALAGSGQPRAGVSVPPALPAASAASDTGRALGGEVPRPSVRAGCDPRRISRCQAGLRASRSREGPAVGGQAHRGAAAAVHAAVGPARDRRGRKAPAGWRARSR